jgi:hypothetical protein
VAENGAGGGTITCPAGPSPLPFGPWHSAHCCAYTLVALCALAVSGPAAIATATARNNSFLKFAATFFAIVRLLEICPKRLAFMA